MRKFPEWKNRYLIPVILIVVIGGWMWQARTTQSEYDLCYHAHFESHAPSFSPRYDLDGIRVRGSGYGRGGGFAFIRHYHPQTQLGYCAGHVWESQRWRYGGGGGGIDYEVRDFKTSNDWPTEHGSYIFVKRTPDRLFPIYVGYTEDLKQSLSVPASHENADCITANGATHIHARLDNPQSEFTEDRRAYLVRSFSPPCNEGHRQRLEMGTELTEGHVVAWTGKSGEEYIYFNDGNYPDEPGNYVFAKYERKGYDANWKPNFEWVALFAGEAESLQDRLTAPDAFDLRPWECAVSAGATHIFVRANDGDRRSEVKDLDEGHHPTCNRLYGNR